MVYSFVYDVDDEFGACVPFVNRPFESEIHRTMNFTHFCCFFARNLVPSCAFVVLSSPKVRSNKRVQFRGLKYSHGSTHLVRFASM